MTSTGGGIDAFFLALFMTLGPLGLLLLLPMVLIFGAVRMPVAP